MADLKKKVSSSMLQGSLENDQSTKRQRTEYCPMIATVSLSNSISLSLLLSINCLSLSAIPQTISAISPTSLL